MANKARGFAAVEIGGEKIELALGLGALAELEDAFGVDSFEETLDFGQRTSAKRLRKWLLAVMRGNDIDLTPERERAVNAMSVAAFMEALMGIMEASGMSQQQPTGESGEEAERPLVAESAGEPG
jgi:hypothetical protein